MEIFATIKTIFRYIALIDREHSHGKLIDIAVRALGLFCTFFIGTTSMLYVFIEAASFADRGGAIVASNSGFGNFIMYSLLQIYRHQILDMIMSMEHTITGSMCASFREPVSSI